MAGETSAQVREIVNAIYSADSRLILASLIRLLGDFDLAEESLRDASGRRWKSGRKLGFPPIREHGWCQQGDSKPSTRCVVGAPFMHRWRMLRNSFNWKRSTQHSGTPNTSKMTGCDSFSLVPIQRCRG